MCKYIQCCSVWVKITKMLNFTLHMDMYVTIMTYIQIFENHFRLLILFYYYDVNVVVVYVL